jgi:predicted neuraminidase
MKMNPITMTRIPGSEGANESSHGWSFPTRRETKPVDAVRNHVPAPEGRTGIRAKRRERTTTRAPLAGRVRRAMMTTGSSACADSPVATCVRPCGTRMPTRELETCRRLIPALGAWFLLLPLTFGLCPLSFAADAALIKSEFIYESGPYPQIHASTIAESSSGLVAAWFGGTHEKNPDVGIWVSRLVRGKWTPSVEVANGIQYRKADGTVVRHPTWNPVLFQPKKGPLMLFYKAGPNPEQWWGMLTTSDDGGKTWDQPRRLPEGILGPIKNKPVQLPNGDILSPSSNETHEKPSKWSVHFERTSDLGKTWQLIGPVNDGVKIQAIQPSILFLGGEKLLALGRSRQDRVFEVRSDDGGRTWGEMTLGTLPNNNSGTDAVTLKDGRHLIVYNHIGGTPGKWGGKRTPLNVAVSQDARTWHAALVLESDPGEYSYPAIIQTKDGLVHITYTWKRQRVKHAVVDPAKLVTKPIVDGQWPE